MLQRVACFLSLLLSADEQDGLARCCHVLDEVVGFFQLLDGLLQVNDIDTVALGVDIGCHLGVPTTGLMPEVNACFQKLLHRYDCHG